MKEEDCSQEKSEAKVKGVKVDFCEALPFSVLSRL